MTPKACSRGRDAGRTRGLRGCRTVLGAVVLAVVTGCSPSEDPAGTDDAGGGTTAPGDDRSDHLSRDRADGSDRDVLDRLRAMTVVPDVRRPRALAQRLRLLDSVLTDRDAPEDEVRRAAELEQAATRTLGQHPRARPQQVLRLLPPALRRKTRGDVEAARQLGALARPQPRLPDWRLVEPPPRPRLLRAYRATERRTGVEWEYLAGIHLVETRMGRIRGVSTAGAQGPMQFLPTTWDIYGAGGDITDVEDAVMAAGRLLRANGAPGDMDRALFAYNQSSSYVFAVTTYAANMRRAPLAYRGYWHWRVLYRHESGTKVLPVGYPGRPAVPLGRS
jgi:hypothetical protein